MMQAVYGCGGSTTVALLDVTGADSTGDADSEVGKVPFLLACMCPSSEI
jgi:hypothetical protein